MAEDWAQVVVEVAAGIAEVGRPHTFRRSQAAPYSGPDPLLDPQYLFTLLGVSVGTEVREGGAPGLVEAVRETLLVAATGDPVRVSDEVTFSALDGVSASSVWHRVVSVNPVSPAGIVLLYEVEVLR